MLRHYSRANPAYFAFFGEYLAFGLHDMSSGVLGLLSEQAALYPPGSNMYKTDLFGDDIHASLHQACGRAQLIKSGLVSVPRRPEWPVSIEPSLA
jgi:hypothetical protein